MISPHRVEKLFVRSAAALLLLTALAKLYSAFGSARILTALDPMMHLCYRQIMVGVGLVELAIGIYLFRGRSAVIKLFAVLWLSTNFVVYRMANDLMNFYVCPCLGTVGDSLHLSRKQSGSLLQILVLYLFLGSAFSLLAAWTRLHDSLNSGVTATEPVAGPT